MGYAQPRPARTLTYNFIDTLAEGRLQGPSLARIGTGRYVTDTITCSGQVRSVYHFDLNQGISFRNSLAQNFISKTYTIELFFKMETMNSWKRVVDFKNRSTDWGCYVFNGRLNFYNIATSDTVPFAANRYQYYTVTRDSVTKEVRVYSSGRSRISFIDNGEQAVLGTDNLLNFFQDDLRVPNEASAGNIALLRLTDRALDSASVLSRFSNICTALAVSRGKSAVPASLELYPNPTSGHTLFARNKSASSTPYSLLDAQGKVVSSGILNASSTNPIDIAGLANGLYILQTQAGDSQRVIIRK